MGSFSSNVISTKNEIEKIDKTCCPFWQTQTSKNQLFILIVSPTEFWSQPTSNTQTNFVQRIYSAQLMVYCCVCVIDNSTQGTFVVYFIEFKRSGKDLGVVLCWLWHGLTITQNNVQ